MFAAFQQQSTQPHIEVASFPAIFPVAMETMSLEDRPDVFLK